MLNRDVYAVKQNKRSISEYYTEIKSVWEELDSLRDLPHIANMTDEVAVFLRALAIQYEEQRLFQFLNGLDEHFSTQRSQILLMSPLPGVETVCAMLQQEVQ